MRGCLRLSAVMVLALGCATPGRPDVSAGHSRVVAFQIGNTVVAGDVRLEACATPSRLYNPLGYRGETLGQTVAADTRLGAAMRQAHDGLIDASDSVLVELLCEWPDAASKGILLEKVATNREAVGDLEGAIRLLRLADKAIEGLVRFAPGSKDMVFEWMARIAEWYVLLDDRIQADEWLAALESMLADPRNDDKVDQTVPALLRLSRLYARSGDVSNAHRALSRLEALLEREGSKSKSAVDKWAVEWGLRSTRALVGHAYVESHQYEEAVRLAGNVLAQLPKFEIRQVPVDARMNVAGRILLTEGVRAVALQTLARVNIARGNADAALQQLKLYEQSIGRVLEIQDKLLKFITRFPESRAAAGLFQPSGLSIGYQGEANLAWLYGQALLQAGQVTEARRRNRQAVGLIEGLRGLVRSEDRVMFFSQRSGPYYSLVDSLLGRNEDLAPAGGGGTEAARLAAAEAFAYAEAARARLLSEQLAELRGANRRSGEAALPEQVALREQELRLRVRAELKSGKRLEDVSAYSEFKELIGGLCKNFPEYAESSYPVPVTAAEVPVRTGEVILAYALLEQRLAIWVFQEGQEVHSMVVKVTRGQVAKRIRDVITSVRPDEAGALPRFDARASAELYGWLLAEPLKAVRAGTKLVIIADGELATLPFEILSPDGSRLVVERHPIVYAPSASVLRQQRGTPRGEMDGRDSGRPALLVGDPDYGSSGSQKTGSESEKESGVALSPRVLAIRRYADARGLGMFSRLRWTDREVREVAATLGATGTPQDLLLGFHANEYDIKRLDLRAYRFIHFAAHGVLAGDIPYLRQPALVLAQEGDLRGEDGFLTMSEVLNLRLRAEVTVLSACQTGLGATVLGEGVVGLMRAFLYSGSRSVVGSLWQVDDESTAALMGGFYRNLAGGSGVSDALRLAKVELRSVEGGRWEHPFYWGAFVVYGPE